MNHSHLDTTEFKSMRPYRAAERGPSAANDPFLNHSYGSWAMLGSCGEQNPSISPHLLEYDALGTVDYFGHTEQDRGFKNRYDSFREDSIPVEQLVEEILWPQQQLDGSQQGQMPDLMHENTLKDDSREIEGNEDTFHVPTPANSSILQPSIHTVPTKRKRGRPRLCQSPTGAHGSDPISDLRRSQLEKNRIAAERCRGRKKESTAKLSADVSVLSSKNEALKEEVAACREQLLRLKNEVLRHAGCGSSIIDRYIANSASNQLNVKVEVKPTPSRMDSAHGSNSSWYDDTPKYAAPEGENSHNYPQFSDEDADAAEFQYRL